MATPFLGEIKLFAGNYQIAGWALCNGQLMAISENEALFSLLGTTYGGDGVNTFGLPDLQGRAPVYQGQGAGLSMRVLGEKAGSESVALQASQYPAHSHAVAAGSAPGDAAPAGGVLAGNTASVYGTGPANVAMAAQGISAAAGGGQPHDNMGPYLVMNYIIALEGVYPSPA